MTLVDAPPRAVAAVARGGLANLAGAGFAGAAGVAVTWLVARALGPAHAGAFFAATAAFTLVGGVARLGTPTGLVYWPARLRARGETRLLGTCLRAGLLPVAAVSVPLAAGVWLAAPRFAHGYAAELRLLAAFLPLAALGDALLAATRGYRAMRPTVLLDKLARPGLQLAGIGALATTALPPGPYAVAWAAPYAPVAALAAYALSRAHAGVAPPPGGARVESVVASAARRALARRFWAFTAPRAAAQAAQTALQRVDVLLVAALGGLPAAALYAVAGRFVVLGQLVNQGVSQAVQPRLAEALATGDTATANRLYRAATGWLVLATWPLYLLVIACAPGYLRLFGDGYAAGGPIVAVLGVAVLVASGCGMVDMVLSMGGRTLWNLGNVALALAVMVALDLALIPPLGALGAAIGLAAAILVNNLLPLAQVYRALRVHPFGAGTLAAAGLAVACFGVPPLVLGRGGAALVATLAAGGAAYLLGALRLRRVLALSL
ncbi:lipopolysaccharide biosynthesis protein [Rhizomonospora bruguierae]|uniref:lipopolysaccharide biosynthesis protein n=1 Tax=Rhizomonospora bruguierae TaxID=1581705 RepID=UPI001BCEC445|nr:polysaccharide biosynthesis C-terminal domain-containing protein [Micromonospora sp. NBRC 107566]